MASTTSQSEQSTSLTSPAGFNHMSLPVKDVKQSLRFFINVLGAEWVQEQEQFAEVRCGGMIIGLSKQSGGWTAPDAEFPHYGFLVDAEQMEPIKAQLDAAGVPTHPIWTRNGYTALMYFRDPSGNLFELYCPRFHETEKLVHKTRDNFTPPVASLSYEWQG